VVVGGVVAYLLTNQKKKGVESTLMLTAQRLDQEEKKNESLVQAAEKAEEKFRCLADELTQARIDVASLQTQVEAEREHNSKTEQMRREQFQEQLRTVQEQFQNLATQVLDQTSDKLKTQNTESMQTLTAPLRQNLEQLQQAIRTTNSETARQTASLSEQLKAMG
jgi:DNA recombination protein RmuC